MIGAKLKVALLYDVWNEDPVATAEKEDDPPTRKARHKKTKKKRKEMTDREEIFEALAKLGHEPSYFELDGRPQSLHSLSRCDADLIFNLTESFDGDDTKEMNVVAYVDLLGIPYTGSGVQASAIAIDKLATKRLWAWAAIPTPAWRELEADTDFGAVAAALGGPVVVKPRSEGSTIGITKVSSNAQGEMAGAYAEASRYDTRVFAEELVTGRELTCAILGHGGAAHALPLVEIRAPQANYDYHSKYFSDQTQYLCPAPLDAALAQQIQSLCVKAYAALGARGWGRIDVMLKPQPGGDQPMLLELNTSPGMTGHSLVPMAARQAGMDFGDLVVRILSEATLEVGP